MKKAFLNQDVKKSDLRHISGRRSCVLRPERRTVDPSAPAGQVSRAGVRIYCRMKREDMKLAIRDSAATVAALADRLDALEALCAGVCETLRAGGKILTAGNGGSAAEAFHMAEELVGRFKGDRVALAGLCLAADGTALTCIGNDYGFDAVFSRQVAGLGRPGDMLVLFSTSGSAVNLGLALDAARQAGMTVACLLGRDGGALTGRADWELVVPGTETERIQEAHQVIVHIVLAAIESAFGGDEP